jgi:hypothetical protein
VPKGFQTILINRRGTWSRPLLVGLGLLGSSLLAPAQPSAASSSITARFVHPVAGPDFEQSALLVIDFFPGDGEAIVGLKAQSNDVVELLDVTARRGQASLTAGGFRIDYRDRAIGTQVADTITVHLKTSDSPLILNLQVDTNVDTEQARSHQTSIQLVTVPPLPVQLSVSPESVYPGETVQLRLLASWQEGSTSVRGPDSIAVSWPAGLTPVGPPVRAGSGTEGNLELLQPLFVGRHVANRLELMASVAGAGLQASPLPALVLPVRAAPTFRLDMGAAQPRLGERVVIKLGWVNDSAAAISNPILMASAPTGFFGAELLEDIVSYDTIETELQADEEKGSVAVRVQLNGDLAPGGSIEVDLSLVPRVTGPLAFAGSFQPADREVPVPLTTLIVSVMTPELASLAPALVTRTDLELARGGLEDELRQTLLSLPLSRGATLRLSQSRADEGNWVVEGLLTDLLLARGVRVLADSGAAQVLHYRLADARVIYSPTGSGWNPLVRKKRRDGRMEVFLRLEDAAGRVLWVQRVLGHDTEVLASGAEDWLGGAEGVDQVAVEADHRAVEIGLSGMIVGGLFFVFFAP